jgi:hypothetical protein
LLREDPQSTFLNYALGQDEAEETLFSCFDDNPSHEKALRRGVVVPKGIQH